MAASFAASVGAWCEKVPEAIEAIFKESAQDVVEVMLTPGPSKASTRSAISAGIGTGRNRKKRQGPVAPGGAGGRMPVDRGFLRASLLASTAAMPTIDPANQPEDDKSYPFDGGQIEAVINGADINDTLFFGFTAAYALRMEYGFAGQDSLGRTYNQSGYAFTRTAAQTWSQIVDANAEKAKTAFGL